MDKEVYANENYVKTHADEKNEIPENILPVFESITQSFIGDECEKMFMKAMEEHLTKEILNKHKKNPLR